MSITSRVSGGGLRKTLTAKIRYQDGREASYSKHKNVITANFIADSIEYLIEDASRNEVQAIELTITHGGIEIPQLVAEHLASWYTLDSVIGTITWQAGEK